MSQLKQSEDGHIIEFSSNNDPATACDLCQNLFRPDDLQCTIVTPDVEDSRGPYIIKRMHFKCKTGECGQHNAVNRIRAVSTMKGFSTLVPEYQDTLLTLYPEPANAALDGEGVTAGEGTALAQWQLKIQDDWARFLVAAVSDSRLADCATAQDFDREDMCIEIRRVARPFDVFMEDQASLVACLLPYCRDMSEDDTRTLARSLAAQIRRGNRKVTRDYKALVRMATHGEGQLMTFLLVHGHYRGRFNKDDPVHFCPHLDHGFDETVFVYNDAWEQVGELTQTASSFLAPLVRQPTKFKFTNYLRMGNLNSSTGVAHRVTQMPINITVETIRHESPTIAGPSTRSRVLGILPSADDSTVRLVTVICPSIPALGGSFTLRWWPGDEDDCFFDFATSSGPTGVPPELMVRYSDGTELLSLEEEWERATGKSLGGVERRYSVPVASCVTVCKRTDYATVAVLHAPPM